MTGIELMREAALLGAQCALGTPPDHLPRAEDGWDTLPEERARLAERLRAFSKSDDRLWAHARVELGLGEDAAWLTFLCAAVEMYPDAAAAVSILGEDRRVLLVTPTVFAHLSRSVLGASYASALASALEGGEAQLAGLVEVLEPVSGLPRSRHALRLRAGVLGSLLSQRAVAGLSAHLSQQAPASHSVYAETITRRALELARERGALYLRSESRRAARQLAFDLATLAGEPAVFVALEEALPAAAGLGRRDRGVLVLDLHGWPRTRALPAAWLSEVTQQASTLVVALVPAFADGLAGPVLDVPKLGAAAARRAWATEVDAATADHLGLRFRFNVEEVRVAVREARDAARLAESGGAAPSHDAIEARARAQGARRMGRQVTVIEPRARLSDLVVPADLRAQIEEAIGWYRASYRVFGEMGVAARSTLGQGLTCLFSGKPGTGKSLAAQCLAGELGLNLYRIDLSQVVSKYIGETEKELSQIFDEADAGHGVLVFDEADALFGRRSEVKDARDRYANIEVGYLLQRLERFDGVAILTTNLRGNIDAAFMRRLRFVLEFPMPDRAMRRQLWERSLPAERFRSADLDLDTFAERFALSGGNIENIGVAAAHLAAATPSGIVDNGRLVRATLRELEKTGRPCTASSF